MAFLVKVVIVVVAEIAHLIVVVGKEGVWRIKI